MSLDRRDILQVGLGAASVLRGGGCYNRVCAAPVRRGTAALLDAMIEDHERATGPWEIEWIVRPEVSTVTGGALRQAVVVREGLEVHPKAMRRTSA